MTTAWADAPWEERALLNPGFLGLLVQRLAAGHVQETSRPLPFVLAFVGATAVLHGPTRRSLPTNIRSSLAAWLGDHPEVLVRFPERASRLVPAVREGVLFGARVGGLRVVAGGGIEPLPLKKRWQSELLGLPVNDVHEAAGSALFVGRWFGRSSSATTILTLWGVKP